MNNSVSTDELEDSYGIFTTQELGLVGDDNFEGNVSLFTPTYLRESIQSSSWDTEFRDKTRFWVQHVLVPVVVIVGVLGNIVTIFILTRRQMRTSSNVYLTALAVSDLTFLVFSFSMSWRHYECMKGIWIYWHYIPFGLWITDASSSTSVWLTVSFTMERYIAVCHPMAGKAYCTEKRAKYVAALVYILCFLLTASTPFEWKSVMEVVTGNLKGHPGISINETVYILENTDLGKHHVYRLLYHWFTILFFVILPLFILAIVNVFLINAVRKSRTVREGMTNSHLHYQRRLQIMRQEDRITITLIAVVIMFLICQVPTAAVLIYTSMVPMAEHGSPEENVLLGLGNIFNLLVAINAACNFLLYTALSDKYRRVFFNVLFVHTKCWGNKRRRERCRRVVYATPTHHITRMNGNTIGMSNLRIVPPVLKVNGFVSIPTPIACSTCGETRVNLEQCSSTSATVSETHELKVLTVLKKGSTSMERFYCSPNNSRNLTLTKEFQSI